MLKLHRQSVKPPTAITSGSQILEIQNQIEQVHITDELQGYIVDLIRSSREHPDLLLGGSPRAAINLLKAARVHALIHGRPYMTHEDVQRVSVPVLSHRLILRPEAEMDGRKTVSIIEELIAQIPIRRA